MLIRQSVLEDLPDILSIYENARKFMAQNGNPSQWGTSRPPKSEVIKDIEAGHHYVCTDDENENILAVFFYLDETGTSLLSPSPDPLSTNIPGIKGEELEPTYAEIDGAWLNDRPYGVVHKIASARGVKGAATYCLNRAYEKCKNLRIDTHDDNIPMQRLLAKLGFRFCGRITLEDGSPRRAYQKYESGIDELESVVAALRSDTGCPWDRRQTHESLKPECIEEAAEVLGGINILKETGNPDNLKEELGDLLLQVMFHCQMAKEEGLFTFDDVARGSAKKMLRRHPHIFAQPLKDKDGNPITDWEEIKKLEKDGREWEAAYLPKAFEEAEEFILAAKKRKHID